MLIVEDGSGLATAEAYISVADADTYHANMGNAAWSVLTTQSKEQNLRKGALYMLQTYRLRWAGYRVNSVQAMDWPRYAVPRVDTYQGFGGNLGRFGNYYLSTFIPDEVAKANAELALRSSAGELLADVDPPVLSEKVGPLEVSYAAGARQTIRYIAIDRLLAPFLQGSESSIRLVRA